jgi:hypothetical protein
MMTADGNWMLAQTRWCPVTEQDTEECPFFPCILVTLSR